MPDAPRIIVLPTRYSFVGAACGAIAAAIPGILRAFFGTSEVIVTIMMNYILLYTGNHIVNNVMNESMITTKGVTKMVGDNASLQNTFLSKFDQQFPVKHWYFHGTDLPRVDLVHDEENNVRL